MAFEHLPRIYYVHPWLAGPPADWGPLLEGVAKMGFSHVLIAPPFEASGSLFLTRDFDRLQGVLGGGDAAEGIAAIAKAARGQNLSPMLELRLDRVAADSVIAGAQPGWFERPFYEGDPRLAAEDRGAALFAYGRPGVTEAATAFWTTRIQALVEAGIEGFLLSGLAAVPPALIRAITGSVQGRARFIGSAPGLSWEAVDALAGSGFDALVASTPWWDFRSSWIVTERDRLRAIAPTLSMPQAPFGRRRAAEAALPLAEASARRALWFSALEADGIIVPMGFEFGAEDALDSTRGSPEDLAWQRRMADFDLRDTLKQVNATLAADDGAFVQGPVQLLSPPGAEVAALLRRPADAGASQTGRLVLANTRLDEPSSFAPQSVLPLVGSAFAGFVQTVPEKGPRLSAGAPVLLPPGGVEAFAGRPAAPIVTDPVPPDAGGITPGMRRPRIAIEAVTPAVDDGRFAVKRTIGEAVRVEADIFTDGHDYLAAAVLWRAVDETEFHEVPMVQIGNDRWAAEFPLERLGRHVFVVEAWRDAFTTYHNELSKKHTAGIPVTLEVEEGRRLVADFGKGPRTSDVVKRLEGTVASAEAAEKIALLLSESTRQAMRAADPRYFVTRTETEYPVDAERLAARFSSWYEIFPRSMSNDTERHGTFDDVIARLPAIRDMGFDTLYFPPIHPIGLTNRKGRNNTLGAGPEEVGSPYAIGSEAGGHDALHPQLGTLEDFRRLVTAAHEHGLELALDFAIQCSPDHPWLKQHPDWFNWRPDGTIRYAENPPKKYEDIVNVDFYAPGAVPGLWVALRDVVLFWVEQGVKVFRVDNPHTKPLPFWEWMIGEVRARHPETIFLAEAFTKPKMMYRLAKVGFPQSYTYFTWRDHKGEIAEYLTELTTTAPRDFFRPHFFVNTPDINPDFLQNAPRPAFLIRAALATTLSGLWGLYNGFELCEGRPDRTRKEYADSEKYQLIAWDYDRPGNIKAEITRLNAIRKANPALQTHLGVSFYNAYNDRILWYGKRTADLANFILVAVNLDPYNTEEAGIEVPLWEFGLPDDGAVLVEDLVNDHSFTWHGKNQFLRLDPASHPYMIFRIRPAT